MNKIRVIDLLNKIANGEEVPNKFKLKGFKTDLVFCYNEKYHCYDLIGEKFKNDCYVFGYSELNDEVEILEEEKIPEKIKLYTLSDNDSADFTTLQDFNNRDIQRTINWILDYLKSKGE